MQKRFYLLLNLLVGVVFLLTPFYVLGEGSIGGRPANSDPNNPRSSSIFIYSLDQGKIIADAITVINNTTEKKTILIYAVDSVVSSDGAFGCAQKVEPKTGVGSWIKLAKSEVTLGPVSNQKVSFDITAPKEVDVGEHNGCIVLEEKKQEPVNAGGGIVLNFRTAIRVAVTIPGEIIRNLEISGYTIEKKSNGGILLKPKIKNTGNVSIDATVTLYVNYFFNSLTIVGRQIFGPQAHTQSGQYTFLRDKETELSFDLEKPFWGGYFESYFTVSYDVDPNAKIGENTEGPLTTLTSPSIKFFSSPKENALKLEVGLVLILLALLTYAFVQFKHVRYVARAWQDYIIVEGDDITKIALKFNISWKELAKVNDLEPPYTLSKGQIIKVPPKH